MREEEKELSRSLFYQNGTGDRLIDEAIFPEPIKHYLSREEELLTSFADLFDVLVEIGCMYGRALDWALAHNKRYVGIDITPRYIEVAKKRAVARGLDESHCQFFAGASEQVDELLAEVPFAEGKRCLLYYPFNCFGNMEAAGPVIEAIKRAKQSFMIGTYWTTEEATADRVAYYKSCYHDAVEVSTDKVGVTFSTLGGLCTIAYHPHYLLSLFEETGLDVELVPLSRLGVAYCGKVGPDERGSQA